MIDYNAAGQAAIDGERADMADVMAPIHSVALTLTFAGCDPDTVARALVSEGVALMAALAGKVDDATLAAQLATAAAEAVLNG